jgi:prevent-host-death family protein
MVLRLGKDAYGRAILNEIQARLNRDVSAGAAGASAYISYNGYNSCSGGFMKTVAATEAKNRLGAILDEAQREPIVIRRQDRDIAVVLSMADYERLRAGNIQAFLDLRRGVAARAAASGLTGKRLARLLSADEG